MELDRKVKEERKIQTERTTSIMEKIVCSFFSQVKNKEFRKQGYRQQTKEAVWSSLLFKGKARQSLATPLSGTQSTHWDDLEAMLIFGSSSSGRSYEGRGGRWQLVILMVIFPRRRLTWLSCWTKQSHLYRSGFYK